VSIPVDDWDRPCALIQPRQVSSCVRGDPALLRRAARELSRAEKPVIVAGASVARDDAWDELIALAEQHNAPVWVSPMSSRNSFPESHRLFAGFLAADRDKILHSLSGHDFILVLGAPLFTYHVEGSGPHVPPDALVFQLTDDPAIASWAPVGTSIVTSLKLGIRDLLEGPPPRARDAPRQLVRPGQAPPGVPMTDKYLLQQVAALRRPESVIVEEAPSSRGALHDYLPVIERDTFFTCASGGLGHGLPAAVGISLARPRDQVIALLGDGSSLYSIQGLWSAAQWGLPIVFIIVNNGRYEALRQFGQQFGLQKTEGTALPGIDFSAIAAGQGLKARRVTTPDELDGALQAAFSAREPWLLDVVVQ
jgi:benzoylformate decarboxylase